MSADLLAFCHVGRQASGIKAMLALAAICLLTSRYHLFYIRVRLRGLRSFLPFL